MFQIVAVIAYFKKFHQIANKCHITSKPTRPISYNKSNFTVGAVRIEGNLPGSSAACAFLCSQCITRKSFLILKMKVNVTEYNIHNGPIRLQMSTGKKVTKEHFSLSRHFRDLKIRDLENTGQGHDVQQSQWRHSMANT